MNKKDESFKDFIVDQLSEMDGVEARRMFGGYGFIRTRLSSASFTRADCTSRSMKSRSSEYRKRKMKPFRPNAKQTLKSYYQVPVEIIEDADQLAEWAEQAIRCQKKIRNLTRRKKS